MQWKFPRASVLDKVFVWYESLVFDLIQWVIAYLFFLLCKFMLVIEKCRKKDWIFKQQEMQITMEHLSTTFL